VRETYILGGRLPELTRVSNFRLSLTTTAQNNQGCWSLCTRGGGPGMSLIWIFQRRGGKGGPRLLWERCFQKLNDIFGVVIPDRRADSFARKKTLGRDNDHVETPHRQGDERKV